jgi:dienelactone hydrolase
MSIRPPSMPVWQGERVNGHEPRAELRPGLRVRAARGGTRAVVLLLHGGKENSFEPSEPLHLSRRRMTPFARALHRAGRGHGVAVWSLAYRVRGWNGDEMSPVPDARWALDQVRSAHGEVPVVLVGHSMGGRVAAAVLDDPSVVAMVGMAPWLPTDEPVRARARHHVLLAHGSRDTTTSPAKTLAWAERARQAGATVTFAQVAGGGHALIRRARLWTDLAVGFALRELGVLLPVGRTAETVLGSPGATLEV